MLVSFISHLSSIVLLQKRVFKVNVQCRCRSKLITGEESHFQMFIMGQKKKVLKYVSMFQSSKPVNSYKHQSKCWCVNLCHVYPKLKSLGFCFSHFRMDFVVKRLLGFNFYFLIYRQKLSGCRLYLWNGHFCTKVIILYTNPDNWVWFFILSIDLYWFPMMVYFPLLIIPECVHVCVYQHHNEGVEQVKQEPHIHHLHVGGLGQVVTHVDKHRCQH